MKKIEAYIRHERFEPIRSELFAAGLPSLTISEALGSGRQGGIIEHYRGATDTLFLRPKLRLEIFLADEDVDRAIEIILAYARTGEMGDGKIFVTSVERAIRIRTGEESATVVEAHSGL
jgi:nitrogen regulatory protein PII